MTKSPDGMSPEELQRAGNSAGADYAYLDQTRGPALPLAGEGDGVGSPTLNPAYYPKTVKPEALHGEAEKAGEEFPRGGTPDPTQEEAAQATRVPADEALKEQQKQEQKSETKSGSQSGSQQSQR